ncbi:MAG TPA: hypothetical protein PLF22_05380 [Pseudomonadales bacterium]|nr:hypothetical protein [Pseudomonadales bacterium]
MNALPTTLPADTPIKTGPGIFVASYPALTVAENFLELNLPTGWMLSDGEGCQLDVVRGCLWLTDTRGKDLWLKAGNIALLTARTLLTAECETVVQLRPAIPPVHAWQPRLQVNARHKCMQLQLKTLSLWQRYSHLFG